MYEDQTEEKIRERMLDNVPSDLDKREGSFIFDNISPSAIEFALAYIELDRVIELGFAQTTYGKYLDYRAGEYGMERNPATRATGQVTVTGSQGATIEQGDIFETGSGVQFEADENVTIDESEEAKVDIKAVEAGDRGNVPADAITEIPVSIDGVSSVTNEEPTSGGSDEESDEYFLERFLEAVREPSTSGNKGHYKKWALEVAGTGGAKVFPIWNGNGTVKVVIINSNKKSADSQLVQDVSDNIEEKRPIGATVTTESASELSIDVSATVVLEEGAVLDDVKANFEDTLIDYLADIAFKENENENFYPVSYAQVSALLLDTKGVHDHSDMTINGGTSNITVGDTADNCQVPVKGTVSLSE